MALTLRDLNRATLARQLLLRRERLGVVDAVHRVVALQAQEAPSPYVALWNRLAPFDPADLDAAFATRAVVKATLMRITLHAVEGSEYPMVHDAMLPTLRAARLFDRRFTSTGLSVADLDALAPEVVAFASEPRRNAEVEAMLAERLGAAPDPGVWWALRAFAPLVHAPTGGPWSFGPRPAYVAAPPKPPPADPSEALQRLIRRYLEGFGPASAEDFAQFALHKRTTVRQALAAISPTLTTLEGPGGRQLFDVAGAPLPGGDTPAPPRLMAMWDSVLLAYADRSRVIPDAYRPLVIRRNGDVLPTLLVDGHVAGVWRPVGGAIEARAFHPLPDEAWDGLAREARDLAAFLARRGPAIYGGRYGRWWPTLPPGEGRVLRA
ncbi:MAG TPA: winged helix DNA-binding domain-containing protein [Acidimicrobiales bacterium]